jgi:hypothetical protein
MMGELKRLHQEVRSRDEATLQLLRRQNEELRAALGRDAAGTESREACAAGVSA